MSGVIYRLVRGKSGWDKRPVLYMERDMDGIITHHNVKIKTHRLSTRYGPYGTIRREACSATSYNVGKYIVDIEVYEILDTVVDQTLIAFGFDF